MKKKRFVAGAVLGVLVLSYFLGSGFQTRSDVMLLDYSVAEDGAGIRLEVQVASSMGYVRGFRDEGGGVKPHYLTFYQTFGGFNSTLGAENAFLLALEPEDTEVYFNRPNGGYELVLQKEEQSGRWVRPVP